MQNIYEKIDTMFSGENDDRPQWAVEILDELKELKELLKDRKKEDKSSKNIVTYTNSYTPIIAEHKLTKYEFIQDLRERYNDTKTNQDILWRNQRLGIGEGGLIYNKLNNKIYSTVDAKIIYQELYDLSINKIQYEVA